MPSRRFPGTTRAIISQLSTLLVRLKIVIFSYFYSGQSQAVFIHQLSRQQTQNPFKKAKGDVQAAMFHPLKPYFFVASQRQVKVYNLAQQTLTKKLMSTVKFISSMDIHPAGDNVIVGSYDCKVCWFDMDLSVKPYKTLSYVIMSPSPLTIAVITNSPSEQQNTIPVILSLPLALTMVKSMSSMAWCTTTCCRIHL